MVIAGTMKSRVDKTDDVENWFKQLQYCQRRLAEDVKTVEREARKKKSYKIELLDMVQRRVDNLKYYIGMLINGNEEQNEDNKE